MIRKKVADALKSALEGNQTALTSITFMANNRELTQDEIDHIVATVAPLVKANSEISIERGNALYILSLIQYFMSDNIVLDQIIEQLECAASMKNSYALNLLGLIYHNNHNSYKAIYYYKRACALDNDFAYMNLSHIYEEGREVDEDQFEAVRLLMRAVRLDNPLAMKFLADLYLKNDNTPNNPNFLAAIELYDKAVLLGNSDAMVALGTIRLALAKSNCSPEEYRQTNDYQLAMKNLYDAVELDNSEAMLILARHLLWDTNDENNHEHAILLCRKASSLNNVKAMVELAYLYKTGIATDKDELEAARLYTKAITFGSLTAKFYLAELYINGVDINQNMAQAAMLLTELLAKNDTKFTQPTLNYLAGMYRDGNGVEKDETEAIRLYKKLNRMFNDPIAKFNLAIMYIEGRGVEVDIDKAIQLLIEGVGLADPDCTNYLVDILLKQQEVNQRLLSMVIKMLINADTPNALYNLGRLQLKGYGCVTDNKAAAVSYFERAKQEEPRALIALAEIFQQDHQLFEAANAYRFAADVYHKIAPEEAVQLYQKSADCGNNFAKMLLAGMYASGSGVAIDFNCAYQLCSEVIELTKANPDESTAGARLYLGLMYLNGDGVTKDIKQGMQLLRESSIPLAKFNLANHFLNSEEAGQNYQEAMRLFQELSELGHAEASYKLAQMHQNGLGGEKDPQKAYTYFKLALSQGYSSAAYEIAMYHEQGQNGASDPEQALKLYKHASYHQHPEAMHALARKYEQGQDNVTKDYVEAIRLYRKSARLGSSDAKDSLATLRRQIHQELPRVKGLEHLVCQIDAMEQYGKKLLAKKSSKGEMVLEHAQSLFAIVDDFIVNCSENNTTSFVIENFQKDISEILHNKDEAMFLHRILWIPIVKNIAIALTGIGLVAIIIKVAVEAFKARGTNKPLLDFNHSFFGSKTNTQTKIESIEHSIQNISLGG